PTRREAGIDSPGCSMSPLTGSKPSLSFFVPSCANETVNPHRTRANITICTIRFMSAHQSGVFRLEVQLVDARARPLEGEAQLQEREEQAGEGDEGDQQGRA